MWSNFNDSFSTLTGHINTLRQSIPSMPFTGEEENNKRCNKTKISLLKAEVGRHRQIAAEYKQRWLKAQELAQSAGASTVGYHDEINLLDDDDVVFEEEQIDDNKSEDFENYENISQNSQQVSNDGDFLQKKSNERLPIPASITDLRLSASVNRIHQLEDEIRKLDADREHWRSLAKQKSVHETNENDTKNQLQHYYDEYHKCLTARSELEQQLLELDSQHELALNKAIQLRDETIAENVQLRARISQLEEQNNNLETSISSLKISSHSTTPPPERDNEKLLTQNDRSNQQVLSTVEFDCPLHANQRPEPDGQASENENISYEHLESLKNQIQQLNNLNQQLERSLENSQKSVNSIEKDAQQKCNQLQNEINTLISARDESIKNNQTQISDYVQQIEHLKNTINDLKENIKNSENKHVQQHKNDSETDNLKQEQINTLTEQLQSAKDEIKNVHEQMRQLKCQCDAFQEESQQLKEAMKRMSLLVQQKDQEVNVLNEKAYKMEVQLGSQESSVQFQESEVQRLENERSRLQEHMVTIEESYVAELFESNEKCKTLENEISQLKLQIINNESKEDEIRSLRTARDKAINEISSLEDRLQQYSTSVANLQGVIEQLEKDHERKLHLKAIEFDKRIDAEKQITMGVNKQLKYVEERYRETVQTLEAANRLTQAIELKDVQINQLKAELKIREDQILQLQDRIIKLELSYEGKVDKQIVKSLVLSYFSTQPGTQQRIEGERLLARFLDFNQSEMMRAGIKIGKSKDDMNDSLVSRFVEFLEHESEKESSTSGNVTSNSQSIELAKDLTRRLSLSNQSSRPINPFITTPMVGHQRTPSNVSNTSTFSEHSNIQNQLLAGTLQPPESLLTTIELSKPTDLNDV